MKDGDKVVYLGTDSGATTSKVGAVWEDGTVVSTRLLQRPTNSREGPAAVWSATLAELERLAGGCAIMPFYQSTLFCFEVR